MALRILLVDDEPIVRRTLGDFLRDLGHQVEECSDGEAAWQSLGAVAYDLALVDLRMPGMDGLTLLTKAVDLRPDLAVVLITGHGTMETAIQALRLGAADFLTKPVELLALEGVLEKVTRLQTLRREGHHLRQTIRGLQAAEALRARSQWFVGLSQAAEQVRTQIRQAVEMDCQTILITGETGTGKEVVARQLHFHACADECPFIVVNCPALPAELVESELFGHVKGAFTGAVVDRAGAFELANNGTLLLDEVADLSAAAQAKLLRVLETRAFQRVGGSQEIHVDLQVVAATNTSLEALVEDAGRRGLEIVDQEAERMARLVENLLQFSRRSAPQISSLDLCQEVGNTLELIQFHLRNRGVEVVRQFAADLPLVQADRQQVRQLLLNLLTNACDAMPQGGTLTVRAQPTATGVAIEIADTGTGIGPEDLPKVMEPFFTTKPEGKGTGLGLAICRRVVQEYGGTIELQSEVGQGTTVHIVIPMRNDKNSSHL